jgi:uncharacterized protein (DUF983 family)
MFTLVQRLNAVLRQKCPKCLRGSIFSGFTTMRDSCLECGHKFEREPGYFTGAMYASYFMAVPILLLITLVISWVFLPGWLLQNVALIAAIPFLFLVPIIVRFSRVLWMHIDHPSPPSK